MIPCEFEYECPGSLDEALSLLAEHDGDSQVMAGGQSLMPLLKLRLAQPGLIVDLARIPELASLACKRKSIEIGAMASERTVELHPEITKSCPALADTVRVIADPHVRNLGTVGGSLCFADPRGDLPAAMLALGATLTAASVRGTRRIGIEDFFLGPFTTALADDELLVNISVPLNRSSSGSYVKLSKRAGDFAVVAVATNVTWTLTGKCKDARVALCATGPVPKLVSGIAGILAGTRLDDKSIEEAGRFAQDAVEPFEDPLVSAEYRMAMVKTMTVKALQCARERAGK